MLFSCQKDELEFNDPDPQTAMDTDLNQFRRKVVNPYTIANMQKATDNLIVKIQKGKLKGTNGKAIMPKKTTIKPNILYIKFTPQTPQEEGLLKRDSTLALIDYPLGYEYDEAFFENRPPLEEGEIPAYYTTVPVDRELPSGVPYEVLEEMYMPQKDKSLENNGKSQLYKTEKGVAADFVAVLLHQAFKQTDNVGLDGLGMLKKEKGLAQNKGIFGDKWLPRGTLRIWDDNIGSTKWMAQIFVRWQYYNCSNTYLSTTTITPGTNSVPIGRCRRPIYRYESRETPGSYVPLGVHRYYCVVPLVLPLGTRLPTARAISSLIIKGGRNDISYNGSGINIALGTVHYFKRKPADQNKIPGGTMILKEVMINITA